MAKYDLGNDVDEYLSTMEEDDEWKKVSDSDCMAFLLNKLPENLKFINESLKAINKERVKSSYQRQPEGYAA